MAYNEYGLTPKQEKFVELVVSGLSQYEAYRQSYSSESMSRQMIDRKASELMAKGKIRDRYNSLMRKALDSAEDDAIWKSVDLMKRLTEISKASICDVVDIVKDEDGYPLVKMKKDYDTRNVKKLTVDSRGNVVVEMIDPNKAMNTLASMLQAAEGTSAQEVKVTFCDDMEKYFD